MGFMHGFIKMYQLASLCNSSTSYHKDIDMTKKITFFPFHVGVSYVFFIDLSLSHYSSLFYNPLNKINNKYYSRLGYTYNTLLLAVSTRHVSFVTSTPLYFPVTSRVTKWL